MYRRPYFNRSTLRSVEKFEGERIEDKVRRIEHENEPITDGAPEIFTERKDGVQAAFNIRTDRWELAAEAMDSIHRGRDGKERSPERNNKPERPDGDKGENGADSEVV